MIVRTGEKKEKIIFNHAECTFIFNEATGHLQIIRGTVDDNKKWIVFCIEDEVFNVPGAIWLSQPDNVIDMYRGARLYKWLFTVTQEERKSKRKLREFIDSIITDQ